MHPLRFRILPLTAVLAGLGTAWAAPLKARAVFQAAQAMPMALAHAGDARVWIAPRNVTVTLFADKYARTGKTFLKVAAPSCLGINDESGLIGMAFHPDFKVPGTFGYGKFYLYHTLNALGHDGLFEYKVIGDPATTTEADPASRREILTVTTGDMHHNGGSLAFDGKKNLFLGIGDGNRGDESRAWAQDPDRLHGKILRIDPSGSGSGKAYRIPVDNPEWPGKGRTAVYALGLRNPYRISWDKAARSGAGALVVGDVGQSAWEEINVVEPGKNYGWGNQEGTLCVSGGCAGFVPPRYQYPFTGGAAVIGGAVYRGKAMPQRRGQYFFADYHYEMKVMEDPYAAGTAVVSGAALFGRAAVRNADEFFSFGEDADGEIYSLRWSGIHILEETVPSIIGSHPGPARNPSAPDVRSGSLDMRDLRGRPVAAGKVGRGCTWCVLRETAGPPMTKRCV